MKNEKLPPVGTKVFDLNYGHGVISFIEPLDLCSIDVIFENRIGQSYTSSGKLENGIIPTLSLTKYDFFKGGFTPISEWNKPKIGDVGYFWDDKTYKQLSYGVLAKVNTLDSHPYTSLTDAMFKNFSPEVPEWYKAKIEEIRKGLKK